MPATNRAKTNSAKDSIKARKPSGRANSTERRKPQRSKAHATVERILNAALSLVERNGYSQLTTNHIAKEAGISIGSLYHYFSDKEQIACALLERFLLQFQEEFDRHISLTSVSPDKVQTVKDVFIKMLDIKYPGHRAFLEVRVLTQTSEMADTIMTRHRERFTSKLTDYLYDEALDHSKEELTNMCGFLQQIVAATQVQLELSSETDKQLRVTMALTMIEALVSSIISPSQ